MNVNIKPVIDYIFKPVVPASQFDSAELERGIKVEMEHTKRKWVASIIARHHLAEDRNYYKKLATLGL